MRTGYQDLRVTLPSPALASACLPVNPGAMFVRAAFSVAALIVMASLAQAVEPGFASGTTTRVSVASDGMPANAPSQAPSLSASGRYAVFASSATNLGAGGNGALQVWRHDLQTGATELVSAAGGLPVSAGAFAPSVSADGRFVAFVSFAADLVPGDTNGALDAFVRDMQTGVTTAVTTTAAGAFTTAGGSLAGFAGARVLSDDGRYAAFTSLSEELVPEPSGGRAQAYVRDLATSAVTRVSVDAAGAPANGAALQATISGDGRVVAFQSASTNLSPLVTSGAAQIYVRDLASGTTTLASLSSSGAPNTSLAAGLPGLSRNGRFVVFETQARLDPADLDPAWDVYLRDLASGTTSLASPSANTFFGADSRSPSLSADGAYVAFSSVDAGMVPGDANNVADVFLWSRASGALTLVSLNDAGRQANAASLTPSVSADGGRVAFTSSASSLVPSPASLGMQIYVRDLATNAPPVVSAGADATVAEGTTFNRAGGFTDGDASTSWTATVDWGDGSGALPLALDGGSFALERLLPVGTYDVSVAVVDDQGAVGTGSFRLTVENVAPSLTLPASVQLPFTRVLHVAGALSDPGTGERLAVTADYGDGSPPVALALSDGTFTLDHAYAADGSYDVTVVASDSNGGVTTAHVSVTLLGYAYEWLSPTPDVIGAGRTLPAHFAVTRPDGSFLLDTSVAVDLVDEGGNTVLGPFTWTSSMGSGVTASSRAYKVSLDLRDLAPGRYGLRVSFDSDVLAGSFVRDLVVDGSYAASGTR